MLKLTQSRRAPSAAHPVTGDGPSPEFMGAVRLLSSPGNVSTGHGKALPLGGVVDRGQGAGNSEPQGWLQAAVLTPGTFDKNITLLKGSIIKAKPAGRLALCSLGGRFYH